MAGPSGTVASTSDAYGQQATQGTQGDTYDALGRDVLLTAGSTVTSLSYQGNGGQLVSDGGSHYTWTPGGTLTGTAPAAGGTGVLDLTDQHTDLVAQFTASGTSLSASRSYGPWGAVTANSTSALAGSLGYQSQYTSPVTGQTSMGARWYNPANGGFGNKDTVSNNPVPDSASASPYAYAADNPLTSTDPTGHGNIFTEAADAVESGVEDLQGAAVNTLESVGLTGPEAESLVITAEAVTAPEAVPAVATVAGALASVAPEALAVAGISSAIIALTATPTANDDCPAGGCKAPAPKAAPKPKPTPKPKPPASTPTPGTGTGGIVGAAAKAAAAVAAAAAAAANAAAHETPPSPKPKTTPKPKPKRPPSPPTSQVR